MDTKNILLIGCVMFFLTGGVLSEHANAEQRIAKDAGKTYGEWSAKWWQWASANGFPDGGAFGDGVLDCGMGQNGPVWFLAGKGADDCCEDPGGEADRICAGPIPRGIRLFFPLINIALLNPDEDLCGEDWNCTVQEKREILDAIFNDFEPGPFNSRTCFLSAFVDGTPVIYRDIPIVRTQSPTFFLEGDPESVSDGLWVMLPKLSKGEHTILFSGALCSFDGNNDPETDILFGSRVKYELTIGDNGDDDDD